MLCIGVVDLKGFLDGGICTLELMLYFIHMNRIYYYLSLLSPIAFVSMYFYVSKLSDSGMLYAGLLLVYPLGFSVVLSLIGGVLIFLAWRKDKALKALFISLLISALPLLVLLLRSGCLELRLCTS